MKAKLFSPKEAKRWNLAFWILALAPIIFGLSFWAYVDLLRVVGLCASSEGWPPPCVLGQIDLVGYGTRGLMVLGLGGWMPYEAIFLFLFGAVIGVRMAVLKFKKRHEIGVMP